MCLESRENSQNQSEPSSEDPEGLHHFWDHPGFARTVEGTISRFLPAMANNRVLASLYIESDDIRFRKFAVGETLQNRVLLFYDFDQKRCETLLGLTDAERALLESQLREENEHAQVNVVERNFRAGIQEEDDMEYPVDYPVRTQRPREYSDRLREMFQIQERRRHGVDKMPVLEFDEAPTEKKSTPRILFTRSLIWLPDHVDTRNINPHWVALTSSGFVYLKGRKGQFFYFGTP